MQYATRLNYIDQTLEHADAPLRIACDECREVEDCILYITYTSPKGRTLCWGCRPIAVHGKLEVYRQKIAPSLVGLRIEDLFPDLYTITQ